MCVVLVDLISVDFYFEGKFENGVVEGMVDFNLNFILVFRFLVV